MVYCLKLSLHGFEIIAANQVSFLRLCFNVSKVDKCLAFQGALKRYTPFTGCVFPPAALYHVITLDYIANIGIFYHIYNVYYLFSNLNYNLF